MPPASMGLIATSKPARTAGPGRPVAIAHRRGSRLASRFAARSPVGLPWDRQAAFGCHHARWRRAQGIAIQQQLPRYR